MLKVKLFVSGNLSNCFGECREIGASPTVVNWLDQGVRIPFNKIPPKFELVNHKFIEEHNEIRDLLKSGAIARCINKPHCFSSIGVVPKQNNKFSLLG